MTRNDADTALAAVLEAFRSESFPERLAQTMIARQSGDRPSDSWSWGNVLLMILAGTDDARGFRQWQDSGRQVRKGSKAFHILAPLVCKRKNAAGEDEGTYVRGFRTVPVFRLEDTEGNAIEPASYVPLELPPLMDVAERFGLAVHWRAGSGSNYRGVYAPGAGAITLLTHDVDTFFHELAHAADHRAQGTINGGQDAAQEIVAETVSAVLCVMYGYGGHLFDCADYIRHYAGKAPLAVAVYRLVARIGKALDAIFEDTGSGPDNPPHNALRAAVARGVSEHGAIFEQPAEQWRAEVDTGEGFWFSNALTFETCEKAESYALDLSYRWTLVRQVRAVPVSTPTREPVAS